MVVRTRIMDALKDHFNKHGKTCLKSISSRGGSCCALKKISTEGEVCWRLCVNGYRGSSMHVFDFSNIDDALIAFIRQKKIDHVVALDDVEPDYRCYDRIYAGGCDKRFHTKDCIIVYENGPYFGHDIKLHTIFWLIEQGMTCHHCYGETPKGERYKYLYELWEKVKSLF